MAQAAQWQPDQEVLKQYVSLLNDTSNSSREVQSRVTEVRPSSHFSS
jgi:hypothetical protein